VSVAKNFGHANKISYWEAYSILISVAFGVGYTNVIEGGSLRKAYLPLSLQYANLIAGIISCYLLSNVKKMRKGKMGSYYEYIQYFTQDRALVFVISTLYTVSLVSSAAFALYLSATQVTMIFTRRVDGVDKEFEWIFRTVLMIEGAIIYPFCRFKNFQSLQ